MARGRDEGKAVGGTATAAMGLIIPLKGAGPALLS